MTSNVVTNSESSFVGDGPSSSVDGTGLRRRTVELELSVGNNGSDSSLDVSENGGVQGHGQGVLVVAGNGVDWVRGVGLGSSLGGVGSSGLHLAVRDLGSTAGLWSGGGGLDLAVADLSNNTRGVGGGVGLDLSVTDLGDNTGRGGGGGSLDLTVTDLGHDWGLSGSGGLDLTVTNLSHNGSGGGGGSLNLAVTDLSDNGSGGGGGGLNLTVANLSDNGSSRRSSGSGSLDLTVTNLGDNVSLHLLSLGSHWVDSNTKSVAVVSDSSGQRTGWSQGGPWVGWDVGSQTVDSQTKGTEKRKSVLHYIYCLLIVIRIDLNRSENLVGEDTVLIYLLVDPSKSIEIANFSLNLPRSGWLVFRQY
ncbi:hypothetical protein OGAPHI_004750 [Ogataea philodendri]|uniref:Uncharacterized protein n=1 Tax=Ogataea philodendri TaxID=1378263 RepID=A0A9P8T2U9_9ASCO|nr:uncharacterized protein OGAPHI_004750 [Ogataea philodendri]KAH3664036.1 hypothetical protein OGAPHI_004750 [Ogataea philodendri]